MGNNTDTNNFGQYSNTSPGTSLIDLSDENQTINSLLSDKNVPQAVKDKFWWIFSRDITLGFLDEKRKRVKQIDFELCKIDYLNSIPYQEYDFKTEALLNQLRSLFEAKLDRALGTNDVKQLNERIIQKKIFQEQTQNTVNDPNSVKAGFWSRIIGGRK
jgi:hypothetical protein